MLYQGERAEGNQGKAGGPYLKRIVDESDGGSDATFG